MNPDISSNIQTLFIEEEATLFKIYWGYFFANGKARDIKGYQAKILNTEGPILIPLPSLGASSEMFSSCLKIVTNNDQDSKSSTP